jgi:3-hexulose-6-phosphate synthase / 6-phospho-3-hexuloisomerase
MKVYVQLALDFVNAERALNIAAEAVGAGMDWLEAGTPLIKSEGLDIIRRLKDALPGHVIVADMKTMDTGSLETEIAAKAGADIVCVLGVADDSTIIESVRAARKYGAKIMVDLINVRDPVSRAMVLERLGVDFLCVHVGIDQQMRGKNPLDLVRRLRDRVSVPLAVAGGVSSESAASLVKAGASIIIVGGAITKAKDVAKATREIKKAIAMKKAIPSSVQKKYDVAGLRKAFLQVSTSNVSDAMHRHGAMQEIRPVVSGVRFAGPALTVETLNGDWAKPIEAIDKAEKGAVLVVSVHGGRTAIWGELATWSAKCKGLAGVVIDGAVRDVDDLRVMKFPVYARFLVPNAGEPKGFGDIGGEILCGGQLVRTGDWIVGDDSGVVVVPQEEAVEIANRALDVKEQENRIREEIKSGGSLGSVLKVKKWEKKVG